MRRPSYLGYLCLFFAVIAIVSLPTGITRAFKNRAVASCSPLWSIFRQWQIAGFGFERSRPNCVDREKMVQIEKENLLLRQRCADLQKIVESEEYISRQVAWLQQVQGRETLDPQWTEFFKRRARHLAYRMQYHLQSMPAKVVFREPRHWGSTLWIDIGEEDNEKLGARVVAHNSPVVIGNALVGVVEQVERNRSEVRLITDARLVPSVRAVRGEQTHRSLLLLIDQLSAILQKRSGLYSSLREEGQVLRSLSDLRNSLKQGWGDYYLAKGELYGSSLPLWRSKRPILHGVGFNYDAADEEGAARDLRTGEQVEGSKGLPLLQPGDLLVTSGLDGIFPQGLEVAIVAKVQLLREGDCTYDLEALPIVEDVSEIDRVSVLPPLSS